MLEEFRLGHDPFPTADAYLDAEERCLLDWANWRQAAAEGHGAAECLHAHRVFVRHRRAADASRLAGPATARDLCGRGGAVEPADSEVLAAMLLAARPRVRRALRRALGQDRLPQRAPWIPADVLMEICERTEAEIRAAVRRMAVSGLAHAQNVVALDGLDTRPLRELSVCASLPAGAEKTPLAHEEEFRPRTPSLDQLVLPSEGRLALERSLSEHDAYRGLCARLGVPTRVAALRRLIVLVGPRGAGKKTLARAIADRLVLRFRCLETADSSRPPHRRGRGGLSFEPSVHELAYAELTLSPTVEEPPPGLDPFSVLRMGEACASIDEVVHAFVGAEVPATLVVALPSERFLSGPLSRLADCVIDLGAFREIERIALWQALVPADVLAPGEELSSLPPHAGHTPGVIVNTVHRALRDAARAQGTDARLTVEELRRALPTFTEAPTPRVARPGSKGVSLDELVLAPETTRAIREFEEFARLGNAGLADLGICGFGDETEGLVALFEGPPGTGKTACAAALAAALGRELVQADLGELLGPFVGETEANVRALFERAQEQPSVLFFDEADGLFSARQAEGPNRHDHRLVNELLVQLERHAGVVVLATNFGEALDPALARRIHYRVPFEAPDEAARLRLWKLYLPDAVPGAELLDRGALAREFALTGAQIRNVSRRCALRAVASARWIEVDEVRAVAREQSGRDRATIRVVGFRT